MHINTHIRTALALVPVVLIQANCPVIAQTSSPFAAPDEKLGTYVANSGPYLDTGCSFRSAGPLLIEVPVPAVVNAAEINPDGTLKDPNKLVNSGILGAQVNVRFPVYDIDSEANVSGYAPEVDRVYFNGKFVKVLKGINNTWTDDSFVIPISDLKFASPNSPNAKNLLQIDIDTGNAGGEEAWCMAVDWIAIEFDCAAPFVLAHGINSDASTWEEANAREVVSTLTDAGVLFERFSVTANGRSAGNAVQLLQFIENFLNPLKAEKVHIIAHSKGGLDAQALQALGPPFKILSLSTLSTPHLGAVAADLSVIQKASADEKINSGADPNGYAKAYLDTWTFGQGPQLPGLEDLTTHQATADITAGLRGNIQRTYTFGGDADLNGNNDLEANESEGLFPSVAHYAARRAWLVMRDFSATVILSTVTSPGTFWGTRTILTYETIENRTPQANDIVVTLRSANPSYGIHSGNYMANHSRIKDGVVIKVILQSTLTLR